MKKICVIVSSEMTVKAFLLDQLAALSREYATTVVVNTINPQFLAALGADIEVLPLAIERDISLRKDMFALLSLIRLFWRRRFDLVHSVTPKAGLLAMLAARLTGVPMRLHVFTGQLWATRQGLSRSLFKFIDRFIAGLATHVLADSASQREFLLQEQVVSPSKIRVLADGSISGVDIDRFRPNDRARVHIRQLLQIPMEDTVFLFIGRLNRDKGILDLATAFPQLAAKYPDTHLLIVGPDEATLQMQVCKLCNACLERVHFISYTNDPEKYMAASDVLCLPSYREGFGTVIIEAAAVGIPVIASRIYGIVDAVAEEESGILHAAGDVREIYQKMALLYGNKPLRLQLGSVGQTRAIRLFSQERMTAEVLNFYRLLLS